MLRLDDLCRWHGTKQLLHDSSTIGKYLSQVRSDQQSLNKIPAGNRIGHAIRDMRPTRNRLEQMLMLPFTIRSSPLNVDETGTVAFVASIDPRRFPGRDFATPA